MFSLTLVTLYALSIKISYSEIKKNERKVLRQLKRDGYFVDDLGKVKMFFNLISMLPGINLYFISFLRDNFTSSYHELIEIFEKKEYISESPILTNVNNELRKLESYEYELLKKEDLNFKIRRIESRRKKSLFSTNADFINMNEEEQLLFLNNERNLREMKNFTKKEVDGKANVDEAILYLTNMKRLFGEDNAKQKVKQFK